MMKLKKIISIFLIELIILLPIAIVDALTISNVRVEDITQVSAKVKWETDEAAEGSVNFGDTQSLGQKATSPNFVKDHSILLTNLVEDSIYFFEVTSDSDGGRVSDNNNGNFYEFVTLPRTALFVNASIPRYYNQGHKIDIRGESIRLAEINMYVDNEVARTLYADNYGNFLFSNIDLNEGENTIRFTAESGGQIVENIYVITVDTVDPLVDIDEIPNIIGSERILINGSVSELVTISFYVTSGVEDVIAPPKITNLRNTSTGDNKVELSWDKVNITDFGKYIIYRDNRAIAVIEDTGYNDYSDVFVNSNRTYRYQVAAMDRSGNLGEKSDSLTVTTLEGGIEDRVELPEADIYEEISGLQKTITTDNTFNEEINLEREDGFYNIKIEAVDIAGNKWVFEKEVLLDTKDPEIEIIFPKSNAEIFENYADMVTIRGKTEPGARVYLYVLRTPFGIFNKTWDVYGFAERIQELPEAELRADCRLEIEGEEQCKSHADYETIADANGYFEFEDIDLTSIWAGAFRITEYPTGEPYYDLVRQKELKDFIESRLFFVAVDPAGRKGVEQINYEIVTCWSTDLTWDVTPLIEYQSPTFLNVERLKEGTESIYFYFNFTYHGRGRDTRNTRITNLLVTKACGYGYLEEKRRYNYSCEILRSCTEKLSPSGKTAYVACPLGRLEGIEKWLDSDWESFIDAVKDEMAFPFRLTLTYDEEFDNGTIGYGRTHYLCTEIGYVVDAAYINPRELLPDWLLYDFVDLLNKSINKLNDWISKIGRILEWTAIGCMVSFFVKFVTQIYRRFTCHFDRFFKKFQKIVIKAEEEDECIECLKEFEGGEEGRAMKSYKANKDFQDLISDTCLEKCYPTCSAAWKSEESLYKTYRWSCDRVFGHASPSRWTETVSSDNLYEKATAGSGCANDESVRGKPLRAISCKGVEKDYDRSFSRNDVCFEIVNMVDRKKRLYTLGDQVGGDIYEIKLLEGPAIVGYNYVIKQNEDYYLTNQDLSCEEICKGEYKVPITKIKQDKDGTFVFETIGSKDKEKKQASVSALCTTTNQCLSFKKGNRYIAKDGKLANIENDAEPRGYTKDCFYDANREPGSSVLYTGNLKDPSVVSGDPDRRMECCCINSGEAISPFDYYIPSDIETKDGKERGEGSDSNEEGLKNMEWSYRYYKMHYRAESGATEYDPNRYIEGRDQMACFGQNHWLYDGFSAAGKGNLLTMDPMKQHIAAFQCVAISQIRNRLVLLKNIMVALENCLLSIRVTGEADSGVCKEIFTQYICAFIWKIISFFRKGCLPFGYGIDFAKSDNRVLEAVSVGMGGVWDSVADSQQELASEYGNAQLNNLLGMGEEDVFRKMCLGAFGYDWGIDAESLLDVAYQSPYKTLVYAVLPSREYLTFDPTNYQAKYEYRASWLLNPGCDLDNYEVYLACVTRNDMYSHNDIDCSKQNDPYGRNCDCLELSPEKAPPPRFYYQSRGRIKQNELQNVDSSQIIGRIKTEPYRYDHLMFKLNVDRNYIRNRGDVSKCFSDGHEDGVFYFPIVDYTAREFAGCSVDITTGVFSCREGATFFYDRGSATIDGVDLDNDDVFDDHVLIDKQYGATYYRNQPISGKVKYSKDDREQCLVVRLYDQNGQPFKTGVQAETKVYDLRNAAEEEVISFNTGYYVKAQDLVNIGSVEEVSEEGFGGSGFIWVRSEDKSNKQDGEFRIEFRDNDDDGEGDEYDVGDGWKPVNEVTYLGGFAIKFRNPDVGTESTHTYTIKTRKPTETGTGITVWKLHLDIRSPKEDGKCANVRGFEYDSSQIMVSGGRSQSMDIPIILNPNERSGDACKESALKPITDECICGEGRKKNCPDGDNKYCVEDRCRKYPKCIEENDKPCVCKAKTVDLGKYDCAFKVGYEADFAGANNQEDPEFKYCINRECRDKKEEAMPGKPGIVLGNTKIQNSSGWYIPLRDEVIEVNPDFGVEVYVDGAGKEVEEVLVIVAGGTNYLTFVSADKKRGLWKGEIKNAPKGEYSIKIYAEVSGEKTNVVEQLIDVK